MLAPKRLAFACLFGSTSILLACQCGPSRDTPVAGFPVPDAAGTDDVLASGICDGTAGPSTAPPVHRAVAEPCTNTPAGDGGARDQCLVDTDCLAGWACTCRQEIPAIAGVAGSGAEGNACVPATCRLDTDCGPEGFCTLDSAAALTWRCTTPEDTCRDPATDCACLPHVPSVVKPACVFEPEVGHYACSGPTAAG